MPQVDLYADFLGGTSTYNVNSLDELKSEVARRLHRNDLNWGTYSIYVNDAPAEGNQEFQDGDVVRVVSPGIKGGK